MAPADTGIIRVMQAEDVPACLLLTGQNNWNQTADDWLRLQGWEPEGCFVLDVAGQVVGTVTTTCYGTALAWIGMMLVDAACRRQGFGRSLLAHALAYLDQRRVRATMLDATPLGPPLYESFGFGRRYTLSRWQGVAVCSEAMPPGVTSLDALDLTGAGSDLDLRAFGCDRARQLAGLLRTPAAQAFRISMEGALGGFVLLRPRAARWHIGPLVAATPEHAARLLTAALVALDGRSVQIDVPDTLVAQQLVRSAGLTSVRPFVRMLRGGPAPAADLSLVYGTAAPEIG